MIEALAEVYHHDKRTQEKAYQGTNVFGSIRTTAAQITKVPR